MVKIEAKGHMGLQRRLGSVVVPQVVNARKREYRGGKKSEILGTYRLAFDLKIGTDFDQEIFPLDDFVQMVLDADFPTRVEDQIDGGCVGARSQEGTLTG